MTEKPKAKLREDNPKQSDAFRKVVGDLDAAGDLDPKRGDAALERIVRQKSPDTKKDQ